MEIILLVIITFLIALLVAQEILHVQERKDLYNRIMARDLTEYKAEENRRTVPCGIRKRTEEALDRRNKPE